MLTKPVSKLLARRVFKAGGVRAYASLANGGYRQEQIMQNLIPQLLNLTSRSVQEELHERMTSKGLGTFTRAKELRILEQLCDEKVGVKRGYMPM